jgi:hypothetical protein
MNKMTPEQVNAVKDLVRYILQEWMKPIESELAAYGAAFYMFTHPYPGRRADLISPALDAARKDPALQEKMREKYHEALERQLQQIAAVIDDPKTTEQWFRHWDPKGPIN